MSTNRKKVWMLIATALIRSASPQEELPSGHAVYKIRTAVFASALGHDTRGNTCTGHLEDDRWQRLGDEREANCSVQLRLCAFYRSHSAGAGCPEMPNDKLTLLELVTMAKGKECQVKCNDMSNDSRDKLTWKYQRKGNLWGIFSDTLVGEYAYTTWFSSINWQIPVNHWATDGVLWLVGEADHMINEDGEQIRVMIDRFVGAIEHEDTSPQSNGRWVYYSGMTTDLDDSLFLFYVNATCGDMYYGCDCGRHCVDTYRFHCNNAGYPICNEHFYNPESYDPFAAFESVESTACSAQCRPNANTGTLCGDHGDVLCAVGYQRVKAQSKSPWLKGARDNEEQSHTCEKIRCHMKYAHDDCTARGGTCIETANRANTTGMFYKCV